MGATESSPQCIADIPSKRLLMLRFPVGHKSQQRSSWPEPLAQRSFPEPSQGGKASSFALPRRICERRRQSLAPRDEAFTKIPQGPAAHRGCQEETEKSREHHVAVSVNWGSSLCKGAAPDFRTLPRVRRKLWVLGFAVFFPSLQGRINRQTGGQIGPAKCMDQRL